MRAILVATASAKPQRNAPSVSISGGDSSSPTTWRPWRGFRRRRHRGDIRAPAGPEARRSCRQARRGSVTLASLAWRAPRWICLGADALGVRPIEQALVAMVLRRPGRSGGLDHAPGLHRGGEGILRLDRAPQPTVAAQRVDVGFRASAASAQSGIAWADVLRRARRGRSPRGPPRRARSRRTAQRASQLARARCRLS